MNWSKISNHMYRFIGKVYKLIRNGYTRIIDKLESIYFSSFSKSGHKVCLHKPTYILNPEFISHSYIVSGPGLRIECISRYREYNYCPELIIGNNTRFNYNCHIGCCNKIIIGNNVLIGSNVLIIDHQHGNLSSRQDISAPPENRELISSGPVIIEDNVWIGENVCILPGVKIGKNSVVGASSVVTKNIPEYSIAVGNPAKIIRTL